MDRNSLSRLNALTAFAFQKRKITTSASQVGRQRRLWHRVLEPRVFGGFFAALLFLAHSALAVPGVTQLGTAATSFGANVKTLSDFTVPAGNNRLLVVTASDSHSLSITTVTFNGTAMTQAIYRDDEYAVDSIWYLPMGSSASSTTGNIVMASSAPGDRQIIGAVVFQSVDQTTPVSGAISYQAYSGGVSRTVTSKAGDLVFDLFDSFSLSTTPTQTPGSGQTAVFSAGGLLGEGFGKYTASTKAGAASVATSWSQTGDSLLYLALNINNGAALTPTTFTVNPTLHGTDSDPATTTLVEAINAANTAGGSARSGRRRCAGRTSARLARRGWLRRGRRRGVGRHVGDDGRSGWDVRRIRSALHRQWLGEWRWRRRTGRRDFQLLGFRGAGECLPADQLGHGRERHLQRSGVRQRRPARWRGFRRGRCDL